MYVCIVGAQGTWYKTSCFLSMVMIYSGSRTNHYPQCHHSHNPCPICSLTEKVLNSTISTMMTQSRIQTSSRIIFHKASDGPKASRHESRPSKSRGVYLCHGLVRIDGDLRRDSDIRKTEQND